MRWCLIGLAALVASVACGANPDLGGAENTGGSPPGNGGTGGSGATLGSEPEEQSGPLGELPESNAPEDRGALPVNSDLCSYYAQSAITMTSVIAGGNAHGSATAAREALSATAPQSPIPAQIRGQDFLNYYGPEFDEPESGAAQAHIQLRAAALPGQYDLLVALRAARGARPKLVVTVALDNTASLGEGGLEKARSALLTLATTLGDGDVVNLVTADDDVQSFALPLSIKALGTAIGQLSLTVERPIAPLLEAAYARAEQKYDASAENRVLILSDGAGDPASLPDVVESAALPGERGGIRVAALGTGPARENDHRLLRALSRLGRGSYHYLDTLDEANAVAQNLDALFGIALDDVRLSLTLPWYFDVLRPYVASSAPISQSEPQYVAPGGTLTFLYRLVACNPEIAKTEGGSIEARFTWLAPGDDASSETTAQADITALISAPPPAEIGKAFAVAAYADALRSLDRNRIEAALTTLQNAPQDPDLSAIATLLASHPALGTP